MSQIGTTIPVKSGRNNLCIPVLNCSMYILSKLLYTHINRPEARFEPGSTAKKNGRAGFELGTFESQDDNSTVLLRLLMKKNVQVTRVSLYIAIPMLLTNKKSHIKKSSQDWLPEVFLSALFHPRLKM